MNLLLIIIKLFILTSLVFVLLATFFATSNIQISILDVDINAFRLYIISIMILTLSFFTFLFVKKEDEFTFLDAITPEKFVKFTIFLGGIGTILILIDFNFKISILEEIGYILLAPLFFFSLPLLIILVLYGVYTNIIDKK